MIKELAVDTITVDLCHEWWVFGVIIEHPTAIRWTNQAGGMSCDHPTAEGFFVPVRYREDFGQSFHNDICYSFYGDPLPVEALDKIDADFRANKLPFLVDRERLPLLLEAWIPVVVQPLPSDSHDDYQFAAHAGRKGIFVYSNCD